MACCFQNNGVGSKPEDSNGLSRMLMTCAMGSRRRRNRGPSEQDHHSDHSMRAGSGASQVNATSDVRNVLPPALGILWTTAAVARPVSREAPTR